MRMCSCLCGCKRTLDDSWKVIEMREMRWGPVVNGYVQRVTVCKVCAEEMDAVVSVIPEGGDR